MDNAGQLLNWGFTATGTALGSEGAPSMPMNEATGMEDPMELMEVTLANFSEQTARRYGDVSDPGGSLWDPRGENALTSNVSDYKTTDLMRPDEIAVQLNGSDDQLGGGDPVLAAFLPDSTASAQALLDADIGLSASGAATLADSLQAYDQRVLDTIFLPPAVEPRVTNDVGLVTKHGGLPAAFYAPGTDVLRQGVPEAIVRVVNESAEFQAVDVNGVVDKYAPGTGPYEAMAKGIIAPPPGAVSSNIPTPSQVRMNPALLSSLKPRQKIIPGVQYSAPSNVPEAEVSGGLSSMSGSSGAGETSGGAAGTSATGGGETFGVSSVDGGVPVPDDGTGMAPVEEKTPCKWWLLAVAGVAAGAGIFIATRKGGKKGKKR